MTILHIETSTNVCSVAVSTNGKCLFSLSDNLGQNHASLLSPFIQKAVEEIKNKNLKIDAIAVSSGPGSYTGLRIGVSTAKGLCYGYGIPLLAISTLEILCIEALKNAKINDNVLLCPMIDARRMEVYTAVYSKELNVVTPVSAMIVDESAFADLLEKQPVYFFGNGAEKCKTVLTHPNAFFIGGIEPMAESMISIAEKYYTEKKFVDVAYYEPFYLKEFQVTTPKILK